MTAEQLLPLQPVTGATMCPACEGRGEVEVGAPWKDGFTGLWDVETRTCRDCAGTGTLPDWLLICDTNDGPHAFDPAEAYCTHGPTLCAVHVFECIVCAAEDSL